ncbi:hypothetical protein HDU92_004565 [Lobulomyces angularis]|nr:hypothetical protein HDU92_004565 [Lobulomyces angularis]
MMFELVERGSKDSLCDSSESPSKKSSSESECADVNLLISREDKNLTFLELLKYNAFWFGYHFSWFLISIVIVPDQIKSIVGNEQKGAGLSLIYFISGVFVLFGSVLIGALNDNFTSRFGKRSPWIMFGTFTMVLNLWIFLWPSSSLTLYTIGFCLLSIGGAISSVPFNGLLTDIAPGRQIARSSAIMGVMNLTGYLIGAISGSFATFFSTKGIYLLISIILISTASLTSVQNEPKRNYSKEFQFKKFSIKEFLMNDCILPLKHRDFRLLCFSRFVFQIAISTVQQFLEYWIGDCTISNFSDMESVSMALLPLLVAAPIFAYFIPENNRKFTVYFSSVFMIISCFILIFTRSFWMSFIISAIFGIGYGPFISVEFAMLMDILPNQETAARYYFAILQYRDILQQFVILRDISIWHTAMILPQLTATPVNTKFNSKTFFHSPLLKVAGLLRDYFEAIGREHGLQCFGYQVLFAFVILYFLAGVITTRMLRGIV